MAAGRQAKVNRTTGSTGCRLVAITARRFIVCSGFLAFNVTLNSPLELMQDARLVRSFSGLLYGYGTLVLASAHVAVDYIRFPQKVLSRAARIVVWVRITGMTKELEA
jgi:hypothetical protein